MSLTLVNAVAEVVRRQHAVLQGVPRHRDVTSSDHVTVQSQQQSASAQRRSGTGISAVVDGGA